MIQQLVHEGRLLAIVIPHDHSSQGVEFCTPQEFSQQLAYIHHPPGKVIPAHAHNRVSRNIQYTLEVLFIRKGKVRVDFYDDEHRRILSQELQSGDTILLVSGGHGFEVLEEVEMIEVKQGPYSGDQDKTRFEEIVT